MAFKHRVNVLGLFSVWPCFTSWGLVNFSWGRFQVKDRDGMPCGTEHRWGLHLLILRRNQWYWGHWDEDYDRITTCWGLGPLGFVSRLNW